MRIGKFSQNFNINVDTIRYYMDLGLLTPQKTNHYYEFDDVCEKDMTLITELKQFHFSLQEIHNILSLKRVTQLTKKEDLHYFIKVLKEKKAELLATIEKTTSSVSMITEKIQTLHHIQLDFEEQVVAGVPVDFVMFFVCPFCQVPLNLKEAMISNQQISSGELFCKCGYKALISDGIVHTKHLNEVSYNNFYLYDMEMFKIMKASFISLSEKCSLWIRDRLLSEPLKGKVIMETHVDTYVFLNKYIDEFEADALYIFCGSTVEMLKDLQAKIQKVNPDLKVLYLLNSGMDLPLKHYSIDYLVDSYSFNEYALFHNALPVKPLSPYLNKGAKIIGSSFYYDMNAGSLKRMAEFYPNAYPSNLTASFIKKNLQFNHFDFLAKEEIGYTTNTGKYLKYHKPGEKATFFVYEGSSQG